MKIKKVKNVYGIKELKNPSYISGNVFLYAPNGVMKTSFADFLLAAKDNKQIVDVFKEYDEEPEYEIEQFGKTYTEKLNDGSLQLLAFTSKSANDNVFTDPNIANLAMSAELRRSYDEQIKKLTELKKKIDSICSIDIKGGKRTTPKSWKDIAKIFNAEDEESTLKALIEFEGVDEESFEHGRYSQICDKKVLDIFNNPEFTTKIETYNDVLDRKIEDSIFKNGFNFFELKDIGDVFNQTHYFEAENSLTIGDIIIDSKEKLALFIENKRDEIFSSPDVEEAFNRVKDFLSANASTKDFASFLDLNRKILRYSSDYSLARKTYCKTKIKDKIDDISLIYNDLISCKRKINSIIEKSKKEESVWKKSKSLFNSRFSLNRVDLDIETVIEDDFPVARIIMIDKVTHNKMDTSMKGRLSSGEYRALLILNLLFEIESKKNMWPDGFTLLLDDVADSFDYKNKYAICRYIEELFKDRNIQIIVMTHNFDFYRCCSFFLSKISHKSLVASRLRRGGIELKNAGHNEMQDLSFAKSWHGLLEDENCDDSSKATTLLSYLPILRNIIELDKKPSCEHDYNLISKYLHFSDEFYSKSLIDLKNLFETYELNISETFLARTFKDVLKDVYDSNLTRKIDAFDIRRKMALSFVLRVLYEKFVFEKSGKKASDYREKIGSTVQKMYEKLRDKNEISEVDQEFCEFARIVSNPYLHVNAFMYEQLIDNSADKIIDCIKHFVLVTGF